MARGPGLWRPGAAGALALLAIAATLAWQAGHPACCADAPGATLAAAGEPPPVLARAPAATHARVAGPAAPAASADAHAAGLGALLQRPPADLRDSVLQALARSRDGGRLYARHLVRQCAAADAVAGLHAPEGDDPGRLSPPDAADPRAARALARVQQLRAACAQFTASELAAGANIVDNTDAAADPLLADLEGFAGSRAQLLHLLAHPDPLLLQELGPRLGRYTVAGEQQWWFDGRRVDPDIAEPALALLPCELGLSCDESDPAVWGPCLQGQGCAGSRAERVLQQAAPGDIARQQDILAWARRMAQAVRDGDADRFLPASTGP